ncbi:cation:proton antiporter [Sporolactobacillus sp. THM7-7]|nr:cation:proton antiporter [Sporolactobacillus sp. THM7-7]
MDHLVLEMGIALVLIAIGALAANKLNFSVIPFLIVIGMLVGPHAPEFGVFSLKFIHSAELIHFLGRMGILFLLFYLGLEFSTGKLIRSGKSILIGGSVYIGMNFSLGLLYPVVVGFPLKESLIIAGIITISSSAIVAKVLVDLRRTGNAETELILGIIMFEDIFLAVYLSIVSGLILGDARSPGRLLLSILIALGYMLLFFVLARKASGLLNKWLKIASDEVFILVIFAALFFIAGFSETIHVAEAIGALLIGLVFSETDQAERMEQIVIPFRNFFGAVFFFSFGLSIDPLSLGGAVWLALGAAIITVIGNFIAGLIAGRISGLSHKASTNIGLTIVSRGEFSIVMANLGIAGGLAAIIQPFSALYVLILAIVGPLLAKESKRIFMLLNRLFKWQQPESEKRRKDRTTT